MYKGKLYVTEDYYGGIRISTVNKNATNIDGRGALFENTGRGSGDIDKKNAERLVLCWNMHDELVEALEKIADYEEARRKTCNIDVPKSVVHRIAEEILAKVRPETDDNDVRS